MNHLVEFRQMFLEKKTGKGIGPPLCKEIIIIKMKNDIKSHTGQLRRSPVLFAACSNSPNISDLSRSFFPNMRSTCWLCINTETVWIVDGWHFIEKVKTH